MIYAFNVYPFVPLTAEGDVNYGLLSRAHAPGLQNSAHQISTPSGTLFTFYNEPILVANAVCVWLEPF